MKQVAGTKRTRAGWALVCALVFLSACASLPTPDDFRADPTAFVLATPPGERPFVVPVRLGDSPPLPFIIDTASTVTALYPQGVAAARVDREGSRLVVVRGIASRQERPEIRIPKLTLGPLVYEDLRAVVLEGLPSDDGIAGIIGLDILSELTLLWDPEVRAFTFADADGFDGRAFAAWNEVPLTRSHGGAAGTGTLLVSRTVVLSLVSPVLIDTGADTSFINWRVASLSPLLRVRRRQLREEWEIAGAVGRFTPQALARTGGWSTGEQEWPSTVVVVADLPAFEGDGPRPAPFMILGADLLADRAFVIDAATARMWVRPGPEEQAGSGARAAR